MNLFATGDTLASKIASSYQGAATNLEAHSLIYLALNGDTVAIDARPSDAIALALRTRAPIFVEDTVIDHAKTVDFSTEKADADRLHKWLESLDPDDLGKYKM